MTNVWRVRMMSSRGDVDHAAARQFAIDHGVVGAGWGLRADPCPIPDCWPDIDLYLSYARADYPGDNAMEGAVAGFGGSIHIDDYCWMYATHTGEYWCGRITGGFEYRSAPDFARHDLHVTRPCVWVPAGTADGVPGVVRRAFAGPFGTFSELVTDKATILETSNFLHGIQQRRQNANLFAVASPEDLEDLVALYLQERGWLVYPSTAKASMASYEWVVVHRATGGRAGVQVKSGATRSLHQDVADDFDDFFVLMANPTATVTGSPKIRRLIPADIERFARSHHSLLPKRLQRLWPLS
jgi:hypothetical protein